ncbi:MAG TPA: protein kinase [Polyangiaceae bacterium]|nr:protein kinase [Polyangiaceae bacterium]
MRKPPSTDQGPTWAPQSVIMSTPYVVRGQLGRGGMGSVYEVWHRHTRLVYAFKVLSTRIAERPDLAERVVREAEFLGLVKGAPHVVTVVEWGRLRDMYRRPYLVMERLYGETLATLLARRALPLTDSLSYVRQVLWGAAAVHAVGGVHRDLKPSNIFVQHDGTCTLLDFGVMKALSEIGLSPRQFITTEGVTIGTPSYMAPEVASHGEVDHRADLFSIGLVLAECLLGFRLLPYLSEDDYIRHLVNEGVPSIELSGGAHLPVEVRRLVRRATMFDPAQRFPTALAFLDEIDRVADALGLRLRPIPPSEHLGAGARRPPRLFRPDAPTLIAGAPVAPIAAPGPISPSELATPPRGAPSALSPSELATPPRGAPSALSPSELATLPRGTPSALSPSELVTPVRSASDELLALATPSAWPTPVDSVSPTRVTTPAPASGDERTPPLVSRRRLRWPGLLWGRLGRAPGGTPTLRVGSSERPTTTLPLPPRSAVSWRLPRLRDRLAPLPGLEATPVNDVLEGPAPDGSLAVPVLEGPAPDGSLAAPVLEGPTLAGSLAVPVLEPPAEPRLPAGAFAAPVGSPRARQVPLASAVALVAAGVVAGAVASLAGVWWARPPAAVVRVSPEPRPAAPSVAPAGVPVAPTLEPPPEPPPPEAPARGSASPSVSTAGPSVAARKKASLEAKLKSGRGTHTDLQHFVDLCRLTSDKACLERAEGYRRRLQGLP